MIPDASRASGFESSRMRAPRDRLGPGYETLGGVGSAALANKRFAAAWKRATSSPCVSHLSRIDHHPLDDYPMAAMSMAGDVIEMAAHGLIQPF